jgi:hypothetical protein
MILIENIIKNLDFINIIYLFLILFYIKSIIILNLLDFKT